ncbi:MULTISPECIES: tyrosine-type recombinase/integrase [Brenneria]|uniref:Integrase n=1 Tax=Brenneria nigrifluens DSM 30175 = ATCC 13028 TaxID=1121120 RepID=A0A2U1UFA5_9GAMM|nr:MULTISPECIES: tyrosine-type recombinase/integrase [Brenneria]EHD22107.1 integrase family protein [Brenneria sp. EniD312]PWC20358.1 integrase [Brenneria nigrifluens] [Brenneria nigrifluens DSM 30175 = ATCC 13028]QCR05185.1 integrase [Brenneria nigrifluens] [Brenneria nigrifluens DSM 30175 = ATCC 13028]
MARKRKNPADNALPPRVYRGKSKYEFHPPGGGAISLCALDSPIPLIWDKYNAANNYQEAKFTLDRMIHRFMQSPDFLDLAMETQRDYRKYAVKIAAVFGAMRPDSVKPEDVRAFMDRRGMKSKTQANREKTFMSRVYRWGYERGLCKSNPCSGVKQFKETARDRYINDEEYSALLSVSPAVVRAAMEIAYLCLSRQGDILALTEQQILDAGIYIAQGKTGKRQIKAWTPRLRAAVSLARSLPLEPGFSSIYVLKQPRGQRYTRDGFNSRWRKAKAAARAAFPHLNFDFTFHDLKAKGVSDLDGTLAEKQAISGHMTISQTARYDRKIQIVPVVGGQNKKPK